MIAEEFNNVLRFPWAGTPNGTKIFAENTGKYEISTETEIIDMWNYVEKLKALE